MDEAKRPRGRPTVYTPEIAAEICERLADGETLIAICRDEHMPDERTVRVWANDDREGFSPRYAQARLAGYRRMAEEIVEISDNGRNDWMERHGDDDAGWQANGEHLQRSRLRVDTRKWLLSKALPKIYGDKLELGSDPDKPLKVEHGGSAVEALAAIVNAVAARKDEGE